MFMPGLCLVEKVTGNSLLFKEFTDQFITKILPTMGLAEITSNEYIAQLGRICKVIGQTPIDEISVKDIANFLDTFRPRAANKHRNILNIVFKHAVANGLCHDNPAEKTIPRRVKKRRQRLSLEAYLAIYKNASGWFKNAMDLALQTLQRREDIVEMKFSDERDGYLHVIQNKTKKHGKSAYIKIKIGDPLRQVINRCRDSMLSPYLIHRRPDKMNKQNLKAKGKKHYTQITPGYLTKTFADIRNQLDIFKRVSIEERPTFHEIRSLGIKLYEDRGVDAQALAGHSTRAMTDKYKQGHEVEWTEAIAGLKFFY
jgi:integrase